MPEEESHTCFQYTHLWSIDSLDIKHNPMSTNTSLCAFANLLIQLDDTALSIPQESTTSSVFMDMDLCYVTGVLLAAESQITALLDSITISVNCFLSFSRRRISIWRIGQNCQLNDVHNSTLDWPLQHSHCEKLWPLRHKRCSHDSPLFQLSNGLNTVILLIRVLHVINWLPCEFQ